MSLWDEYSSFRVLAESPALLRHEGLLRLLAELHAVNPQAMSVQRLGESSEGRSISQLTLGNGPTRILAWSQMHGDEPTHTDVLLTLVNLLQRFPEHASTKSILSGCTLYLIPMLNPDGAERYTRRNAQDIDVNRDALQLQSPEGRVLRKAVEDIRPHFALNLHNQRPRYAVDAVAGKVAAVSLLVPPIDAEDTQTKGTRLAKQVAACLIQAVTPSCEGMISRYSADFMSRCFGEWVQQQGIATLAIEAGGWTTPDLDLSPLEQVHFVGLVGALEKIASEAYLQSDPGAYDALPRSAEHDLFDFMLRSVSVVSRGGHSSFTVDIGINYSAPAGRRSPMGDGRIVDLGDLRVTSGKVTVDANGWICMPGRIAYAPDVTPTRLPDLEQVRNLLAAGVTTIIGNVNLDNSAQLNALGGLQKDVMLPLNLGFVGSAHALEDKRTAAALGKLVSVLTPGLLAVWDDGISKEVSHHLQSLQIPLLHAEELTCMTGEPLTIETLLQHTQNLAMQLGLCDRGSLQLGSVADLLLVEGDDVADSRAVVRWSDLQQVLVAGTVVFDRGEVVSGVGGVLLTSSLCGRSMQMGP